jgi:hypothetical protein
MAYENHWLPGFNFNVEEWDAKAQTYETLAICRSLELARAVFAVAIAEKPAGRFMIRSRTRVVKRHPEGEATGESHAHDRLDSCSAMPPRVRGVCLMGSPIPRCR